MFEVKANADQEITCPFDSGETKSSFTITRLSVADRTRMKDGFTEYKQDDDGKMITKFSQAARNVEIVKCGLKGVKNFGGLTVNGKITQEVLEELNKIEIRKEGYDTLLDWIADKIWLQSSITDEERKN